MISQNKPLSSERGSALVVTMLLVSVLLVTALILLQRIMPYANSVRSIHDASQAYYTARGQVEEARYVFAYGNGGLMASLQMPSVFGLLSVEWRDSNPVIPAKKRGNFSSSSWWALTFPIPNDTNNVIVTKNLPNFALKKENYSILSANKDIPLQVKLFPNDINAKGFGTSKTQAGFHTLYKRNSWGLRFDLRGVATNASFTLKIASNTAATVTLKMQYYKWIATDTNVDSFTATYTVPTGETTPVLFDFTATDWVTWSTQSITSSWSVGTPVDETFRVFMGARNCVTATICSLTLVLDPTLSNPESIDFQLVSNQKIPDLNAVVIGDGLSDNRLYYQRIIELIPTPQDI